MMNQLKVVLVHFQNLEKIRIKILKTTQKETKDLLQQKQAKKSNVLYHRMHTDSEVTQLKSTAMTLLSLTLTEVLSEAVLQNNVI